MDYNVKMHEPLVHVGNQSAFQKSQTNQVE